MRNLFERSLVHEQGIDETEFLNRLAAGQVVELEEFEDYAKDAAIDAGYLFWIDGISGKRYLGSIKAWNSFYNLGVKTGLNEDKKTDESQEELIARISDELLTQNKPGSAIGNNPKTYRSIDFTTNCPMRDQGKPCPYCYVEHSRNITKNFVRNLVINNKWTAEDFDKILGIEAPVYHKDVTNPNNPEKNAKKGDTFKPAMCNTKLLYSNRPYNGEVLRMKQPTVDKLNAMGGIRLYSSGDYTNTKWEDDQLIQLFDDADARGLKVKAITKQIEFIKKWSDRTHVTNLSVDNMAAYGLESNTVPLEIAKEYKDNYSQVTIRAMAFNPQEVIMYANNPIIDVVTLFHGDAKGTAKDMDNKIEVVHMGPKSKAWKDLMKILPREKLKKFCCGIEDQKGEIGKCVGCDLRCGSGGCEEVPTDEEFEMVAMECFYKGN